MTDSDIVNQWLENLDRKGKSKLTQAAYRRALAHFVAWSKAAYGQDFDPAAIIPRDVEDWKSHQRVVEKAAPATVNQRLVALSGFFQWAQARGLLRSNPTAETSTIRLNKREPKGLGDKELRRLLRAVHSSGNLRDIAIVELLAGTGLRVSELLALTVSDLVIKSHSGFLIVRKGKHGSYREVPLTAPVRQALNEYLAERKKEDSLDESLWQGQRGALSTRSAVIRLLEKYAIAAQLPAFGPHTLRHTFATRYLKANPGDLRGLAALLGHASLNTVMIYTEPTLDDLAERMFRVENGTSQTGAGHPGKS